MKTNPNTPKLLSLAVASVLFGTAAQAAETGLVMSWSFDQVSGSVIKEGTGQGQDGEARNTPVLTVGKVGQALRFDGASDQVTIPVSAFPQREVSVAMWVKDERGDGRGALFSYKGDGWQTHYFSFGGMDDLNVAVGDDRVHTGVRLGDGQWHHLVVSWNRLNGHVRVFKDGLLAYEGRDLHRAQSLGAQGAISLGVTPNKWNKEWGFAFGGLMDEVQIYDRMLSEAEVAALAAQRPLDDQSVPTAPGRLDVVAVSPQETYLTWSPALDDEGVAGYHVYRDGQRIATTGETRFLDRGLTPGATVTYTVQAFDLADKLSPHSTGTQVTLPAGGSVLDVLPPGHWYEAPGTSIEAQLGKTPNVMKPWSSAAYDTLRDRLVVAGGGHKDYSGNELYAFDVNSLQWIQLTQPTPKEFINGQDPVYGDGRPSAVHTYDGLEYLPNVDRMFMSGGSIYGTGGCSGKTWLFDFEAQPAEDGWQLVQDSRGGCGMISAYDPVTGKVWYAAGRDLLAFDPLNLDAPWTQHSNVLGEYFKFYMTGALDSNRHLFAALGGTGYGGYPKVITVDLDAPVLKAEKLATTGATEIEDSDAAGFVYDPVSDRFVAWNGGASVYSLDVDNQVWSRLDPAETNVIVPSAPAENGTYGRFRYIPSKNAFILVNRVTGNVFFYKLSDGQGVALPYPRAEFRADALTVEAGASVTLSWNVQHADGCVASGDWSGAKGLSGQETVGPLTGDARFVLTCSSAAGEAVRSLLVQVAQPANVGGEPTGGGSEAGAGAGTEQGGTTSQPQPQPQPEPEPVTPQPQPISETENQARVPSDTLAVGSETATASGDALGGEGSGELAMVQDNRANDSGAEGQKVVVVTAATGPLALLAGLAAALLGVRRRRA